MTKELIYLERVICSSDRVKKAKAMMHLRGGEFIIQFKMGKGVDVIRIGVADSNKERIIKWTGEKSALIFYDDDVTRYVQAEVMDYFGIELPLNVVMDYIFMNRLPSKAFEIDSKLDPKSGRMKIIINLNTVLNPSNLDYLMQKIVQINKMTEEFHKTNKTQGLKTAKMAFIKIKPKDHFDEKFELYKRYSLLKSTFNGGKIPREEMEKLVNEAKMLLGKVRNYDVYSLRKEFDELKTYLGRKNKG